MKLATGQGISLVYEDLAERLLMFITMSRSESPRKLLEDLLCPCDTAPICDLGVTRCEDLQQ